MQAGPGVIGPRSRLGFGGPGCVRSVVALEFVARAWTGTVGRYRLAEAFGAAAPSASPAPAPLALLSVSRVACAILVRGGRRLGGILVDSRIHRLTRGDLLGCELVSFAESAAAVPRLGMRLALSHLGLAPTSTPPPPPTAAAMTLLALRTRLMRTAALLASML